MRCRHWFCSSLFAMSMAAAGCSGETDKWTAERPKSVPASGTVQFEKRPVEGATVVFQPDGAGHTRAATGVTDSSGNFKLQTYDAGDGAVPGKFKVTITKVTSTSTATSQESKSNDTAAPKTEWIIPKKYGNVMTSGLTAEVKDGDKNEFAFDLQK